jgi:hypothetical protein
MIEVQSMRLASALLSLVTVAAFSITAVGAFDRGGAGVGGGLKGIGGMGGGCKGIGGMGGGCRGLGDAGGGFGGVQSRYHDYYYSRYGENSTRYGENNTRYGGTTGESGTTTRYGMTTGRYGEPVDGAEENSVADRYERASMYSGLLQRVESIRYGESPEPGAIRIGAGSAMQRLRSLEANPPTSFNHIYVE